MSFSISDPSTRTSFSVSLNSMDFIHCTESYGGGTGVSLVQPDARLSTGKVQACTSLNATHGILDSLPDASDGTSCQLPVSRRSGLGSLARELGFRWQMATGGWQLHFKEDS